MTQEPSEFRWNGKTEEAAQLVSDGNLTYSEIAERLEVGRTTIYRWMNHPGFAARIEELNEQFRKSTAHLAIARKEKRINAANRRWLAMQKVIDQRSEAANMQDVPGGSTGLIVHNVKGVGKGEDFQLVDLYEVDTALLNEMRQTEKQAAQELGQWTEQQIVTTDTTKPPRIAVAGADARFKPVDPN